MFLLIVTTAVVFLQPSWVSAHQGFGISGTGCNRAQARTYHHRHEGGHLEASALWGVAATCPPGGSQARRSRVAHLLARALTAGG